jgi:DNA-binding MurR/RpiR family transcriptional regulator
MERLKNNSGRLTEADRKLVDTLLSNSAQAAFLSGSQLAERANVHEAAATRLAQKLGFKGYPQLREQLQNEMLQEQDAANRIRRSVSKVEDGAFLADLIHAEIDALENLGRCVSQRELDEAADAVFAAKRVFIFGQGHAEALVSFLRRRIDRFGMTAVVLTGRRRDIAERLVGMSEGDVVVAFAFRVQPGSYAPLMKHAAACGARTILISDLVGPAMQPKADLMLVAPRGRSGSEFQTPTVPFAIVNALLLTIAARYESQIIGTLEKLSKLFSSFD